ncbi:hypothetical protein GA0061103_0670 [Rhizobium multihospitium]|uniref:Uncharacterized protein n=2 Tax=Rhizobium multihospitium TaxID=410764 RepID=A0A1C3XCN2_9HYPH|nr:hypothetical protein GA0061103_0670 [Rhizobium multihospitium]
MERTEEETMLRPSKRVHKLLLSSPAHFIGEFNTPEVLISLAWPPFYAGRSRWFGGNGDSLSRTAIVLAFLTPPPPDPAPGVMLPNYEAAGEVVASVLSVLFGKRFDSHGPFEMSGHFGMPELSAFSTPCDQSLRHNDRRSRADRPIPLNLSEIGRVAGLITNTNDDPRVAGFLSAARFYRKALIAVEADPESAYLNLITAGEIVSNFYELTEEEAIDNEARLVLERIAKELPDGKKLASFLRARMRGIKRRFVSAITSKIDDSFFDRTEAEQQWGSIRKGDFPRCIAAAYDLRSRFVHSGYPFGQWISLQMERFEVQVGRPVVPDKEMGEVLARAPLFSGLERIMRYALLTFATELGAHVDVAT